MEVGEGVAFELAVVQLNRDLCEHQDEYTKGTWCLPWTAAANAWPHGIAPF